MKKIVLLFLLLPLLSVAQNKIEGTFSPAENYRFAFLYKSTPEGAIYVDRAKLDSLGGFSLALDASVEAGIYKVVYNVPPEENNFDLIYNAQENVGFTFSKEEGVVFTESKENKLWDSYLKSLDMVNQAISNYYTKNKTDEAGFNSIIKTLKDTQVSYEELAKGTMIETFIKANKPYIPDGYEDLSTYSKHLKANFFKHIDFSNDLLRSSSFINDHVTGFIFGLSGDTTNDTYIEHVTILAKALASHDAKIQAKVLESVWQEFKRRENHDLANYISETYLLELAKSTKNQVLEQQLISYKNTSIGAIAPDFIIQKEPSLKLSELKGDNYYVLIFWSSGCSHCLNELPKVNTLMSTLSNTKVVAFGLENDTVNWSEEIKKYPDFVHGIGLGKWEHPLVKTYAIAATPTYFVLDANKKIIAKPYDFEGLEIIFNEL